jgi:hypothetical protein
LSEKKEFGSCAGFMNNGVNFGGNWNEFVVLEQALTPTLVPGGQVTSSITSEYDPMVESGDSRLYGPILEYNASDMLQALGSFDFGFGRRLDGIPLAVMPTIGPGRVNPLSGKTFKQESCDRQANLAAADSALPGLAHAIDGDYRPLAATAASSVATDAATTAAGSYSALYAVRSAFGIPMSVGQKVLGGVGVALSAVTGYKAYWAMHDTYQSCMKD